mgnify:CR=1 FL=1
MYTEGKTLTLVKVSIIIGFIKFIGGRESHKDAAGAFPFFEGMRKEGYSWCLGKRA